MQDVTLRRARSAEAVRGIDVLCHTGSGSSGLGIIDAVPIIGNPDATIYLSFSTTSTMSRSTVLIAGQELASYGFPNGHPFGMDRYAAFMAEAKRSASFADLEQRSPRHATRAELEWFHTPAYIDRVVELSKRGRGVVGAGGMPGVLARG